MFDNITHNRTRPVSNSAGGLPLPSPTPSSPSWRKRTAGDLTSRQRITHVIGRRYALYKWGMRRGGDSEHWGGITVRVGATTVTHGFTLQWSYQVGHGPVNKRRRLATTNHTNVTRIIRIKSRVIRHSIRTAALYTHDPLSQVTLLAVRRHFDFIYSKIPLIFDLIFSLILVLFYIFELMNLLASSVDGCFCSVMSAELDHDLVICCVSVCLSVTRS